MQWSCTNYILYLKLLLYTSRISCTHLRCRCSACPELLAPGSYNIDGSHPKECFTATKFAFGDCWLTCFYVCPLKSQLIQELITSEEEFIKEMDFVTSHHLKHIDEESTPPEIRSHKETIFRNISDIGSFHSRYVMRNKIYYCGVVTRDLKDTWFQKRTASQ